MLAGYKENNREFGVTNIVGIPIATAYLTGPEVNFQRPVLWFTVKCDDMAGIPASTTLAIWGAQDDTDPIAAVYGMNSATALTLGTLPTTGTFYVAVTSIPGLQRVKLVLDKVVTAPTTFYVRGFDGGNT